MHHRRKQRWGEAEHQLVVKGKNHQDGNAMERKVEKKKKKSPVKGAASNWKGTRYCERAPGGLGNLRLGRLR